MKMEEDFIIVNAFSLKASNVSGFSAQHVIRKSQAVKSSLKVTEKHHVTVE